MNNISKEELELAIGAHGLEMAPWYSPGLVRRILAELQRQVDTRPAMDVGDALLNVVAPPMVEAWLAAAEPTLGMSVIDTMRTYGLDEHGLVWPGSRTRFAPVLASQDPAAAATLRRPPIPGTVFCVITYGHPEAARIVMAALPYDHFEQQAGARPA